ncbi:hypothetical protein BCR35DRAFT_307980 [Leucosporidium creatinivorum]|uniref:ER transporter 6TM N-terminal domain-containing protein n=1 Tax=Leucosporidium creatinivorum TaxID=106004 RepID=A0A1Y2ECW6_9BASI|nr:hypothetical protein BCR35DRAFT_307980 [Leucosporidium creatinivorum]
MSSRSRGRHPRFTIDDDEGHDSESEGPPAIVINDEGEAVAGEQTEKSEKERGIERRDATEGNEGAPLALGRVKGTVGASEEKTTSNGHSPESSNLPAATEKKEDRYPPEPSPQPSPSRSNSHEEPAQPAAKAELSSPSFLHKLLPPLLSSKLNWKGIRPALRASVAAWCGLILILHPKSQAVLGQASFLCLIVSIISPAALPIASALETSFFQFVLVASAWAWSCTALAIAHAARSRYKFTQSEFTAFAAAKFADSGLSGSALSTEIQKDIFNGAYLEPASSAVCGIFLGVGVGSLLWLRGWTGPGPMTFGVIFAIILINISLTTAVLFPCPFYSVGWIFFLPFTCQQAINIACTFFVFPETLAHQFADRLIATLEPLQTVIQLQQGMLDANPRTDDWLEFKKIKAQTTAAMGGVALLGASEANLTREISYARVSGKDLTKILNSMRVLVTRTTGFVRFYEIVEQHLHRGYADGKGGPVADQLVVHLGRSRPTSPEHTPSSTRPPSPTREHRDSPRDSPRKDHHGAADAQAADPDALSDALLRASVNAHRHAEASHSPLAPTPTRAALSRGHSTPGLASRNSSSASLADLAEEGGHPRASTELDLRHSHSGHGDHHHDRHSSKRRSRSHHRHHHGKSSSHISLPSLLHDVLHANIDVPKPVGVMESQRYMDLEDYLHNPRDEEHIEEIISLLSTASRDLIAALDKTVGHLITVIHRLKSTERTFRIRIHNEDLAAYERAVARSQAQLEDLEQAFEAYRNVKRLEVVTPFASLFDPFAALGENGVVGRDFAAPSHRGLYWAFSYQASLLAWSEGLMEVFRATIQVEKKRRKPRIWTPEWAKFQWGNPHGGEEAAFEDENPDDLEKLNPHSFSAARNPDFRPPKSTRHVVGIAIYDAIQIFSRKDVLFGVKLAIIMGLVSMPAYFASTSYFFYRERGLWVIIMAAITSTQYVGDTTFGFVVRIVGTFVGAVIGLLVWSIAAQNGTGNPFAVAAVMAVVLPCILFYRIHWQPIMSAILPSVTIMLVVGYSWQNAHQPALSSVGWGWDIAWRRFVCVTIGISVAFIAAYLPPKVTQKGTVRRTYSKVIGQLGSVTCQILSFANLKEDGAKAPRQIIANLTTLRAKVAKTNARKGMIKWEVSLRGPWPEEHYNALQNLQMELLDLLGQLFGVFAALDSKWTKALLHRSQFSNPHFLGDMLNAFQLISTALEHGTSLPMMYNPLLERFLKSPETEQAHRPYAFDVVLGETEVDGLPTHVNLETICSLDYLRFSCGISQCYAIVNAHRPTDVRREISRRRELPPLRTRATPPSPRS